MAAVHGNSGLRIITPTKGIAPDKALLTVGAQILQQLNQPITVSQAWRKLCDWRVERGHDSPISFGWFVLALDVLNALGLVEMQRDLLAVRSVASDTPNRR
ncbi:MAG TPA: ABC-three component system middle component 6 [Streptosporangiaceae bacterium]|nr:ABC-three component system middle component 6 [Streptosporangiaceae bacterium]